MAMVVKNNMSAVRTLNTLNQNSSALQKSLSKVSSGMKINSAQDDASGYAISERMRVQIRSLDQANQNTQNASSLMKTAEGAVSSTMEILKTLKEKAINAATDTNTDADRATIQKELDQYIDQIDDNALTTFNGKYLVDGSKSQQGVATYTAMTNQSLKEGTAGTTKLVDLENRNGENLEIHEGDYATISYVQDGKTYTTKFEISDSTTLQDVFQNAEDIDSTTKVFADATNEVMQHFDTTLKTKATQIDTLKTAMETAEATMTASKTAYDTAVAAEEAADTTIAEGTTALGEYDATNHVGTSGDLKTLSDAVTAYETHGNIGGNAHLLSGANAADFSSATDAEAYVAAIKAKASATYESAAATGSNDDNGKAAAVSAAVAAVEADIAKMKTDKTALATQTTNALATYNTDKAAYETAANNYKEAAGPVIMTDENVGVSTAKNDVTTADGTKGVTITAQSSGIGGQISGLTISITDSEGNVKKSANAALDAFKTTVYAKNVSDPNEMSFQVGAGANQAIAVGLDDMRSEALGLKGADGSKVSVATQDKANAAVAVFDNAIQKVLDQQATIGAIESRLEYTSQNLTTSSENVQAAESTIRDADMAKEMTTYTKNNVLLQAAQSMLAQANQNSSAVLSLLQ